ncbi:pyridoxine/pyridoxamine 5'-phosphate oxidase [Naasia aerilata]|uniref:Pyridoxamine 5'-phosphate oxidase n=1 Tax=Naasia aerilata TaxID=1162966 RepID=A0ABM8GE12_9MICO|nr:pyridoxine 5'-phosphate oxidase C-terminal domain-containing protein [Naasia aerilata]BDZ46523.1 pyridoxamine 5'-phosphate oxidase [Naasia aerilata]
MTSDTAAWFRSIPSLTGAAPSPDLGRLPTDPVELFLAWLRVALEHGVPEPLATTLATVDAEGVPDSRTLILKDVDSRGWAFAGPASSGKGAQLASAPAASLNSWWQPLARAVRVRGPVVEASREESDADLAARHPAARAEVAAGDWTLWRVEAIRVEFWQGAADRRHLRIVYTRSESAGRGWELTVTRAGEELRRYDSAD